MEIPLCHLLPLNTKNLEGKEASSPVAQGTAVCSGKLLSAVLEAQGGACAYPSHKSIIRGGQGEAYTCPRAITVV